MSPSYNLPRIGTLSESSTPEPPSRSQHQSQPGSSLRNPQNTNRFRPLGFEQLEDRNLMANGIGTLDPTFDTDGVALTDVSTATSAGAGGSDAANAVAVQSDGKVVVVGSADFSDQFALVRYELDGSLDPTFGTGGIVVTQVSGSSDIAYALEIQSDGKILVSGTSAGSFVLFRYNSNGTLDTTFGTGGRAASTGVNGVARSIAVQSDGKILVAGNSTGADQNFLVARYNANGSLDTSFATSGVLNYNFGAGSTRDIAFDILVQPDDKIVVGGTAGTTAAPRLALIRLNSNGTLDTGFGSSGQVLGAVGTGTGIGLQSTDQIVIGGYTATDSTSNFVIQRFNTDGTLDTAFGTSGTTTTDVGGLNDTANALAVQDNDTIVMAGTITTSGNLSFGLVRYTASGQLDTQFGNADIGIVIEDLPGTTNDTAFGLAIDTDTGKFYVAGTGRKGGTNNDFAVARFIGDPPGQPTVDLVNPDTALTYTEGDGAVAFAPLATVVDITSNDFDTGSLTVAFDTTYETGDSITIDFTGNFTLFGTDTLQYMGSDVGTLNLSAGGGLSGNPLVVNFTSATVTPAVAQELVRALRFSNATQDPTTNSRVIRVSIDDGDGSPLGEDTRTITVVPVNQGPTNSLPSSPVTTPEETPLVFSTLNGNAISVSDPDAGTSPVQITLSSTNGVLTLASLAGLTFTQGTGINDTSMTFTGTLAAINVALDGLTFTPDVDFTGTAQITLRSDDQGATGTPGSLVDLDVLDVDVTPVNDPPVNTVPGGQSTDVNLPLVFSLANGNEITVSDVDAGTSPISVTLSINDGTLTLGSTTGLDTVTGDGSALVTITGTIASINNALDGLTYTPSNGFIGTATLQIQTSDQGNTGSGGTQTDTDVVTIDVIDLNSAPVITVPSPQNVNEDTSLVFSAGGGNAISIADNDAGSGELYVILTATNGTLTLSGTTGLTFISGTGTDDLTMTFTGTLANINAALEGLTFTPDLDYSGSASLDVSVDDQGNTGAGGALSDYQTISITVDPVNDAPVITSPGPQTTPESTPLSFSSANSNLISVADVDAASNSVRLSLSVANGTLTLSGTAGLTFLTGDGMGDAVLVFTGTLANINAALDGLIYAPTFAFSGTDQLNILIEDLGNTGAGGLLSDSAQVDITIAAVNDPPTVTVPGNQTVAEDTGLIFSSANGNAITVGDPDAGSLPVQVTLAVSQGTLTLGGLTGITLSVGDGTNDSVLTFSGTLTDINAALEGLIYQGSLDYVGADLLVIMVDDQGNTGSGGPQTVSDSIAIDVTPVNDPPAIFAPTDAWDVLEDVSTPLAGLSIADVDAGSSPVMVTLTVQHGTLTLRTDISGGITLAEVQVLSPRSVRVIATLAAINLTFSDPAGVMYLGDANYFGSDHLSMQLSDLGSSGVGGAHVANHVHSIVVAPVNDAPYAIDLSSHSVQGAGGNVMGKLSSSDVDDTTFTYTLMNDPSGAFQIVGSSLSIRPGVQMNLTAPRTVVLTVETTDASGASFVESFTVVINPAPLIPGSSTDVTPFSLQEGQVGAASRRKSTAVDTDSTSLGAGILDSAVAATSSSLLSGTELPSLLTDNLSSDGIVRNATVFQIVERTVVSLLESDPTRRGAPGSSFVSLLQSVVDATNDGLARGLNQDEVFKEVREEFTLEDYPLLTNEWLREIVAVQADASPETRLAVADWVNPISLVIANGLVDGASDATILSAIKSQFSAESSLAMSDRLGQLLIELSRQAVRDQKVPLEPTGEQTGDLDTPPANATAEIPAALLEAAAVAESSESTADDWHEEPPEPAYAAIWTVPLIAVWALPTKFRKTSDSKRENESSTPPAPFYEPSSGDGVIITRRGRR